MVSSEKEHLKNIYFTTKCIGSYITCLTYVINNSILEDIFPPELKLAKVVPLKSGDSSQIINYRRVLYHHITSSD